MSGYTSYRFGAGRYLQENDILDYSGEEILRYGTKAYVIGGPRALAAAGNRMKHSFHKYGLDWELESYEGFTSYTKTDKLKLEIAKAGCNVLVGVGGGRIMDLTKAAAADMKLPVVLIPTSSATCAAYSPLSVMYTDEGECVGYQQFDYEINSVLVDEQIMAAQPPRLLAAGIMDAMAKYIEIANGKPEITIETDTIEKYSAYSMAREIYEVLEQCGKEAYEDVRHQKLTKTVHNAVFCAIALTGIVSALMRAKRQTALAHKIYEALRTCYFKESNNYLHGEIVATGLIAQLKFNNNEEKISSLKNYMDIMKMPLTLQAVGLNTTEDVIENIYQKICEAEFMEETKNSREVLWESLKEIY